MTAFIHITKNAQRPTPNARRSSVFTFGVQRSAFGVRRFFSFLRASASPRETSERSEENNVQRSSIFIFGVRRSPLTPNSSFLASNSSARTRAAAFTLVETALALLAISLGLLGIFGLARHGLKNGGDTENETRCALLADTVFETLKAKNNALLNEGVSLDDWLFFWYNFCENTKAYDSIYSCYLPQLSNITSQDTALKIIYGTHNLQDQLPATEPDKWNPRYNLTFQTDSKTQFTVELQIHPGSFQSGADVRTYYTMLSYAGGLP